MEPTLDVGQRVLVNRFLYHFTDPSVGDIIVFHPRPAPTKKPAASAGCRTGAARPATADRGGVERKLHQAARRRAGRHVRSSTASDLKVSGRQRRQKTGEAATRSSARRGREACNFPKPIVIPPDHYFMMGDNRGQQRQPLLGPRPPRLDHRQGLCHLLAAGPRSASSKPPHQRRLARSRRLFAFDRGLGSRLVAGADEAGRGCLAGPLVAAAVLIDYATLSPPTGARWPACTTPSR